MQVNYLGHACFCIKSTNHSLVIDPFGDIGYKQEFCEVDYCLTTHDHFDHCTLTNVKFKQLIDKNTIDLPPFIKVVNSYHDEVQGLKRGLNNVYLIELDGITVCHLGDIGQDFDLQFCKKLGKVDLLLIPIGGKYTIDARSAKKYADSINPRIIVPMHYKTKLSNIDIADKNEFLSFYSNIIERIAAISSCVTPISNK